MNKLCDRCGNKIKEDLRETYKSSDTTAFYYWCQDCVENPPNRIQNLFDKIKEALNDTNAASFESMDIPMKATVAHNFLEKEIITGETIGDMVSLRTLMASGLEPKEA